ncbi:unnamed protein product [Paramecium pentaurelia]|uniref:Uncharacterized protein n=1 Tax=Paramecium pentaurelia TaxID=43138 RepID=A0A8S1V9A0_9CILI|nr:unnamed protein product [Paramecium pentaurelia]
MSRSGDFQTKVEMIIENYLQKHKIFNMKNSINHVDVPISEFDLLEKQMTRNNIIDDLIQKIQVLIEASNYNSKIEIEQKFIRFEQEISNLRSIIMMQQDCNPPQLTITRSENNSFIEMSDSFLNDENAISFKKKVKEIQEQFSKKTQQLDNMLTLVIDQQLQLKQQITQNPSINQLNDQQIDIHQQTDKILDLIQPKIQYLNKEHFEEKYQQFKKAMEEMKKSAKEKQSLLMTIVDECKRDCEKIEKKLNEHINQVNAEKKKSWIPFK